MALRPRGAPAAAAREEEAVRATAATAVASRSASGGSGANGSDASGSGATLRAAAIAVDAPEVARACRVGSAINLAGVACGAGAAGGRGGGGLWYPQAPWCTHKHKSKKTMESSNSSHTIFLSMHNKWEVGKASKNTEATRTHAQQNI